MSGFAFLAEGQSGIIFFTNFSMKIGCNQLSEASRIHQFTPLFFAEKNLPAFE